MRTLIIGALMATSCNTIAQQDYAQAQHLSTYFLGAQRSGDNQSWIHDASHTQDGQTLNPSVDLTGGWHDCGDHIKFSFTNNWAATMYLFGYHLFPEAYADNYSSAFSAPPANGIPDILDEVKIQTDYIIKSYNNGNVVQQIGSGDYDHDGSFAEPAAQSALGTTSGGDPRPVYTTTSCPNILGSAAASLALMSMAYESIDATYAQTCLSTAIAYYNLGVGKTGSCGSIDCSSGGNACYDLSSSESDDEMAMAAACLYEATQNATYLTAAQNYYDAGIWSGEIHYYGAMDFLVAAQLYRLTGTTSYLQKLRDHFNYHNNANFSSLGFYKYQWSGGWGNLQYTGNEAFIAAILHHIDPSATTTQYSFVKNNVDFILGGHSGLGNIPANFSFLIGYNEMGGGYPLRPHHKAAFGSTRDDWALFTQETNNPGSVTYAYELSGALVGGPNDAGNYTDVIDAFENSEVCTYYNAGFTGAVAYVNKKENNLVTSSSESPTPTFSVFYDTAQGQIFVQNNQLSLELSLFDVNGKLILSEKINNPSYISVQQLTAGVYLLKDASGTYTQKIIVK